MRTHKREQRFKPPRFELEDVEDCYTYYVLILGLPEDIFWHSDVSFVRGVVDNKSAYDGWLNYVQERERRAAAKKRKTKK